MKLMKYAIAAAVPVAMVLTPISASQAQDAAKPGLRTGTQAPTRAFTEDHWSAPGLFKLAQSDQPKKSDKSDKPSAMPKKTDKADKPDKPSAMQKKADEPSTKPRTGRKPQTNARRKANEAARKQKARNMQRIKAAKPLAEATAPVKRITGAAVRNKQYKQVATVQDLRLKDGKVSAVIIATGGFLGMGEDYYTVPQDKVRLYADKDTVFVVVDVTKASIDQFAKVEEKDGKWARVPKQTASDREDRDKTKGKDKMKPKSPAKAPSKTEKKAPKPAAPKDGDTK